MKIKPILLFLLFLLFLSSCVSPSQEDRFEQERRKVIHQALRHFIKAMEAKGFHAGGIGEGLDHSNWKQNYLGVTFEMEHIPDVDFARKIEVETIQEFLHYINSEEGIEDYVAEYPYPLKFIRIAFISLNSEEGLFSVSNYESELIYRKDNPPLS